jgi:flagellar biogenesis protein FliO
MRFAQIPRETVVPDTEQGHLGKLFGPLGRLFWSLFGLILVVLWSQWSVRRLNAAANSRMRGATILQNANPM